MKLRFLLTIILVLAATLSRADSGQESTSTLYFAPVGGISSTTMARLVRHYRRKFGVEIRIVARIQPHAEEYDAARQQFVAEALIRHLQQANPDLAKNPKKILIGITDKDIYPKGRNWQFCFGWRDAAAHMAIVSTARMSLHYEGEPSTGTDAQTRLQKVITKDIGIMYFGKSPSNNPHSVLFSQILGIQELDTVSEDF